MVACLSAYTKRKSRSLKNHERNSSLCHIRILESNVACIDFLKGLRHCYTPKQTLIFHAEVSIRQMTLQERAWQIVLHFLSPANILFISFIGSSLIWLKLISLGPWCFLAIYSRPEGDSGTSPRKAHHSCDLHRVAAFRLVVTNEATQRKTCTVWMSSCLVCSVHGTHNILLRRRWNRDTESSLLKLPDQRHWAPWLFKSNLLIRPPETSLLH